MTNDFSIIISGSSNANTLSELKSCNEVTKKHGLILNDSQIAELADGRQKALKDTDRVEFNGGILKKLILAFCDSPYLTQDNYLETMYDLQEAFYFFKNESYDTISDDEIIEHMRTYYDGYAQGSTEYIIGTSLEELCRFARVGNEDEAEEDTECYYEGGYDDY
jgi:hypothetical protein